MTVIERHKRNHICNVSLFPSGQTELAKLYHREELSKEIAFGWALCLIQTIGKWENGNLHGRIHGKSFSISIMTFLRFFFIFFFPEKVLQFPAVSFTSKSLQTTKVISNQSGFASKVCLHVPDTVTKRGVGMEWSRL